MYNSDDPPLYVRDRHAWEIDYLSTALEQHGGNTSAAARSLGMSREHLHKRVQLLRQATGKAA
jgi:DNA-binding NtrC family response regulator